MTISSTISNPSSTSLQDAESLLNSLIAKKKQIDKTLFNIETNIYQLEGQYLESTSQYGNLIKGFDGYLTRQDRKRMRITAADRIFSSSSVSFKGIEKPSKSVDNSSDSEEYVPLKKKHSSSIIVKKQTIHSSEEESA